MFVKLAGNDNDVYVNILKIKYFEPVRRGGCVVVLGNNTEIYTRETPASIERRMMESVLNTGQKLTELAEEMGIK